ncbi:MAG: alanine racemase [Bryobacterales bacterium]
MARDTVATTPPLRTHVRVDLRQIAANFAAVQAACPPDFELMGVVKANAYGHGAVPVSQTLERAGCRAFGVASMDEGGVLREAGIAGEIFVLSGVLPSESCAAAELGLTPMLCSREAYAAWRDAALALGRPLPCHLHVETGMNRLGLHPGEAAAIASEIAQDPTLTLEGVCTHLASAEDFEDTQTPRQMETFSALLADLEQRGIRPKRRHVANSGGLAWRGLAGATMARPGLAIYGYLSAPVGGAPPARFEVRPALEWRAAVLAVKEVPPRANASATTAPSPPNAPCGPPSSAWATATATAASSGCGRVWLAGGHRPILGRISMDLTAVDITDAPPVQPGDEAIVLGAQVPAAELAALCNTIPYEILTGIAARAPRIYSNSLKRGASRQACRVASHRDRKRPQRSGNAVCCSYRSTGPHNFFSLYSRYVAGSASGFGVGICAPTLRRQAASLAASSRVLSGMALAKSRVSPMSSRRS